MKGDIVLKINKKIGITFGLLFCGLTLANFVSVINADSSGGVVFATPEYTVGAVVLRMDDVNPSTLYGGTWTLITGDATLAFGDGSVQSGDIIGDNSPIVPVPLHSHTASQSAHNHNRGSMNITGAIRAGAFQNATSQLGSSGAFYQGSYWNMAYSGGGGAANTGATYTFDASRTWSGVTNSVAPSITVNESGTSNAKIDVRGQRIKINVWKKTL